MIQRTPITHKELMTGFCHSFAKLAALNSKLNAPGRLLRAKAHYVVTLDRRMVMNQITEDKGIKK